MKLETEESVETRDKIELKKKDIHENDCMNRDKKWFNENREGLRQMYCFGYVAVYNCRVMEYGRDKRILDTRIKKRHSDYALFYIGRI